MNKIRFLFNVFIYAYGVVGIYTVTHDWLRAYPLDIDFPKVRLITSSIGFYAILIGLPFASLLSFARKGIKNKLLGFLFLFFFVLGLLLIDRALV